MITSSLAITAAVALVSASIILTVSAMVSLRRFEKLYVMQMQTMAEIIYAVAAARDEHDGYYDDEDTDEEEQSSKPELVAVIPFRSGSGEDKSDNDSDSKE